MPGTRSARSSGHVPAPLSRRLTVTLVVLLVLFVGNAVVALVVARGRDHARAQVEQRLNPAQIQVERLLTTLVNQESGDLGYQLTSDRAFLSTYHRSILAEQRIVAALRRDLAGHRQALAAVSAVEESAVSWRRHAQGEISTTDTAKETPAEVAANALQGRALFDDVRTQVALLTQRVAELQSAAEASQGAQDAWLLRIITAELVTAVLVIMAGLVLLRRGLTRPLEDLVSSIGVVAAGDLAQSVSGRGPREFVEVGAAVEAMRQRMLRDASETLNRSLILVTEEQRRQLAADIHDDPTQALTAVTLRLQRLRRRLTGRDAEMLADAESAASAALQRLRRLIFDLHSPTLDTEGLAAALRVYLEETFAATQTAFELVGDDDRDLPVSVRALAYRLARGAILNVAKHADASHVSVRLAQHDGRLTVSIGDDGVGFDPAAIAQPTPGHLGLVVSARFAEGAGGDYRVDTAPGRGTTVTFWLPAANEAP